MTHKTKKNLQKNKVIASLGNFSTPYNRPASIANRMRGCETAPMKPHRTFKFKIRGQEILYTIFHKQYVSKVIHQGIWPFRFTQIFIVDDDGEKRAFMKNGRFWFTSKEEHDEIREQLFDWLHREKIIDQL